MKSQVQRSLVKINCFQQKKKIKVAALGQQKSFNFKDGAKFSKDTGYERLVKLIVKLLDVLPDCWFRLCFMAAEGNT